METPQDTNTQTRDTVYKVNEKQVNLTAPVLNYDDLVARDAKRLDSLGDILSKINMNDYKLEEELKFILNPEDHFMFRKICESILSNEYAIEHSVSLANSNVRPPINFLNLIHNVSKNLLAKYENSSIDDTYLIFGKITGLNKLFEYTHALVSTLIYIPYITNRMVADKKISSYEYYQFMETLNKLGLNKSIDLYPTNKLLSETETKAAYAQYELAEDARMRAVKVLTEAGQEEAINILGLDKEIKNPAMYSRPIEKDFEMKKLLSEFFRFLEKNVSGKNIKDYITNSIINNLGVVQVSGDGFYPICTLKRLENESRETFIARSSSILDDVSKVFTSKIQKKEIPQHIGENISFEIMRYGEVYIPEIDGDNKFMSTTDNNPKLASMTSMLKDYEYSQIIEHS